MDGATIKMELQKTEDFLDTGITKAYFIAETNKGEGYFKIKDSASGESFQESSSDSDRYYPAMMLSASSSLTRSTLVLVEKLRTASGVL